MRLPVVGRYDETMMRMHSISGAFRFYTGGAQNNCEVILGGRGGAKLSCHIHYVYLKGGGEG